MRALSLHHLTALDVSPADLVSLAAELGVEHVCLFTQVEPATAGLFPAVSAANSSEVRARCAATGVTVCNLEYFPLTAGVDLSLYKAGLDIGAALGARRATCHVQTGEPEHGIDLFGRFCDLAAEYGLEVGLEFTGFSQCRSIGAAAAIVEAAGRANGGIVADALHLFRTGGTPGDVARYAHLINYIQVCDGPAEQTPEGYFAEAVHDRLRPGSGVLPLAAFAAALPPRVVAAVEVPQTRLRDRGVSVLQRTSMAVDAARRILARPAA